MRRKEPDRIRVVFRRGRLDERHHALPCGIVRARSASEVVIPELEFCFRFALLDPRLPDTLDRGPVTRVERLLRLGQQFLAKCLLQHVHSTGLSARQTHWNLTYL